MIGMQSKNSYKLPVEKERIERIITKQGMLSLGQRAHVKNLRNAIDFVVPEGTKIFAAADGTVAAVKDDSNEGGPDKKFWNKGNFAVIKHANNEFTLYEHLKHKGVMVKVGEEVKQGQAIGLSGNTGYSFKPHLHFEVFIWPSKTAKPEERESIKVCFKDFEKIYDVGE